MKMDANYMTLRFAEIRQYVSSRIEKIDAMELYEHKFLCMFSLLEMFAQEAGEYPARNTNACFCNFVLKYQSSYDFLEDIDPITLYYDFCEHLGARFNLNYLEEGYLYTPMYLREIGNAKEIANYVNELNLQHVERKIQRHTYVRLLYTMRSKLSHEGSISTLSKIASQWEESLPSYISCGFDEELEWHLGFPYPFLKSLTTECIENFLKERESLSLDPFENNSTNRKHFLAWVD